MPTLLKQNVDRKILEQFYSLVLFCLILVQLVVSGYYNSLKYPQVQSKNVWKSSASEIARYFSHIDLIDGALLESGVHSWKIKVNHEHGMGLGVVCASQTTSGFFAGSSYYGLGDAQGTWAYRSSGDVYYAGRKVGQTVPYVGGSNITFTLDLTGNGTLYAGVDDWAKIELFSNMKSLSDQFIPAAYLYESDAEATFSWV